MSECWYRLRSLEFLIGLLEVSLNIIFIPQ